MQKFSEIKPLLKKYGEKIVLFTIFVDELKPQEYKDLGYLEERININILYLLEDNLGMGVT